MSTGQNGYPEMNLLDARAPMAADDPTIPPFSRNYLLVGLPIVAQVIGLLLLSWLVPPRQFGDYALAYVLVSLLTLLTTSWIGVAQFSLAPGFRTPRGQTEFFTTSVILSLLGSLPITFFGLLLLGWAGRSSSAVSETPLYFGLLSLPFLSVFCSSFTALSALDLPALRRHVQRVVPALGMFLGLLLIPVMGWNVGGMFAGSILAAIVALMLLRRDVRANRLYSAQHFSRATARLFLKTGLPLMLPPVCWLLIACGDRFLIALLFGNAAAGVYSMGWSLADRLLALVPAMLLAGLAPSLVRIFRLCGRKETAQVLGREMAKYLLLGLPVLVTVLALGTDLFRLSAPGSYAAGGMILPWIAVSTFGVGFAQYALKPLLLANQIRRYSMLLASAVGLNIVANLLLIPMLGLAGAGIASVLTLAMLSMSLVQAGREIVAWRLEPSSIVVPAVSGLAMAGAQIGLSYILGIKSSSPSAVSLWVLLLAVAAGFAVYFAVAAGILRLLKAGLRLPATRAYRRGPLIPTED